MVDRRAFAVTLLVLAALFAFAQPAYAEGGFTSYMKGVREGFDSRTWTDKNRDTQATQILLASCTRALRLQLTREKPWYLPDENRGTRAYWDDPQTRSWGRQPSGDYHFTVVNYDSGDDIGWVPASCRSVRVRY